MSNQYHIEGTGKRERGHNLLKTGLWSDCEVHVRSEGKEKIFKVHRLFLTWASPVFGMILHAKSKKEVEFTDMDPDIFEAVLQHIYEGSANIRSYEGALDVLKLARQYMMPELVTECAEYLAKDITVSRAWPLLDLAIKLNVPALQQATLKFIRDNSSIILSSEELENVNRSTLEIVLKDCRLKLQTELEVFEAAQLWAKKECERQKLSVTGRNQRKVLGGLIKHIRFRTLSLGEFFKGPGASGLLTDDEVSEMIICLDTNGAFEPPKSLSDTCEHRLKSGQRMQAPDVHLMSRNCRGVMKVQRISDIFPSVLLGGFCEIEEKFQCTEQVCLTGITIGAQEKRQNEALALNCESSNEMEIHLFKNGRMEGIASYSNSVVASYTNKKNWGCDVHVNLNKSIVFNPGDILSVVIEVKDDQWYPRFYDALKIKGPFQPQRLDSTGFVVGFIYTEPFRS